jgi:type II secretory pathway predicted ATPase ExeA
MSSRRLTKAALSYLEKSDAERVAYCKKDQWITYASAMKLLEILEDKFHEPSQLRNEGLLVYSDYNNGKTAILKKFYTKHKASFETINAKEESVHEIPIIYFEAPSIPDEGRLYSLILDELCVPHKVSEKAMEKARLVEHYLRKLNTKMILIDEIHSALTGNLNKQRTFINDLKHISNKLSLAIILAGTRDAFSALTINDEIASRFPSVELPRWSNNRKFRSFLASYESCLPLKKASNIADNLPLVDIIYQESEGLIGKTVNLMKKAAVKAIKSGRERITAAEIEYLPKL